MNTRPAHSHSFPLTPDYIIELELPNDLTQQEAERVGSFVRAVAHSGPQSAAPGSGEPVDEEELDGAVRRLWEAYVRHTGSGRDKTTAVNADDLAVALNWIGSRKFLLRGGKR